MARTEDVQQKFNRALQRHGLPKMRWAMLWGRIEPDERQAIAATHDDTNIRKTVDRVLAAVQQREADEKAASELTDDDE